MDITGSELVTSVFGCWPSFHDAEVVRLELTRGSGTLVDGPDLLADVHAFEMTDEVAPDGHYILRHHVLVSFRFSGIDQLRLDGWNNQNAIFGLGIVDIRNRQLESLKYEVTFDPACGVSAEFMCHRVAVESVRPWDDDGLPGIQSRPKAL